MGAIRAGRVEGLDARLWKHKDDANVVFLRFENMKKDLSGAVKTIINFIGVYELRLDVVITEQCTIESMQVNDTVNFSWRTDQKSSEPPFMWRGSYHWRL